MCVCSGFSLSFKGLAGKADPDSTYRERGFLSSSPLGVAPAAGFLSPQSPG